MGTPSLRTIDRVRIAIRILKARTTARAGMHSLLLQAAAGLLRARTAVDTPQAAVLLEDPAEAQIADGMDGTAASPQAQAAIKAAAHQGAVNPQADTAAASLLLQRAVRSALQPSQWAT